MKTFAPINTREEALNAAANARANAALARKPGAEIYAPDDALRRAARDGDAEAVTHWLTRGADVHSRSEAPLRNAAWRAYRETVKVLLLAGADARGLSREHLRRALGRGKLEKLRMQSENTQFDPGADNSKTKTKLSMREKEKARRVDEHERAEMGALLIASGADMAVIKELLKETRKPAVMRKRGCKRGWWKDEIRRDFARRAADAKQQGSAV